MKKNFYIALTLFYIWAMSIAAENKVELDSMGAWDSTLNLSDNRIPGADGSYLQLIEAGVLEPLHEDKLDENLKKYIASSLENSLDMQINKVNTENRQISLKAVNDLLGYNLSATGSLQNGKNFYGSEVLGGGVNLIFKDFGYNKIKTTVRRSVDNLTVSNYLIVEVPIFNSSLARTTALNAANLIDAVESSKIDAVDLKKGIKDSVVEDYLNLMKTLAEMDVIAKKIENGKNGLDKIMKLKEYGNATELDVERTKNKVRLMELQLKEKINLKTYLKNTLKRSVNTEVEEINEPGNYLNYPILIPEKAEFLKRYYENSTSIVRNNAAAKKAKREYDSEKWTLLPEISILSSVAEAGSVETGIKAVWAYDNINMDSIKQKENLVSVSKMQGKSLIEKIDKEAETTYNRILYLEEKLQIDKESFENGKKYEEVIARTLKEGAVTTEEYITAVIDAKDGEIAYINTWFELYKLILKSGG